MSGHDQRSVRSTLNRCRHRASPSSRKLVLNIFLKLSEQTFNFDNLSSISESVALGASRIHIF